jgi:hypothetical protein
MFFGFMERVLESGEGIRGVVRKGVDVFDMGSVCFCYHFMEYDVEVYVTDITGFRLARRKISSGTQKGF